MRMNWTLSQVGRLSQHLVGLAQLSPETGSDPLPPLIAHIAEHWPAGEVHEVRFPCLYAWGGWFKAAIALLTSA